MPDRRPRPVVRARVVALLLAVGAIAPLAVPGAARAQRPAPGAVPSPIPDSTLGALERGARIRVTLERFGEWRVAGRIDSVLTDAFVLDTAERRSVLFMDPGPELLRQYRVMRVNFEDIQAIEVSRGHSRWRGALRWGLIGGAIGGVVTGLSGSNEFNPSGGEMLRNAGVGLAIGGVVGGTIGYFTGREVWDRIR